MRRFYSDVARSQPEKLVRVFIFIAKCPFRLMRVDFHRTAHLHHLLDEIVQHPEECFDSITLGKMEIC